MEEIFLKAYHYWFGELNSPNDFPEHKAKLWFSASSETDQYLKQNFETALHEIVNAKIPLLELDKKHQLGLILILDQFSRNIFRKSPQAFAQDSLARNYLRQILDLGATNFYPVERVFLYLPLEHSENNDDQNLSVHLFTKLYDEVSDEQKEVFKDFLDFAFRHQLVIEKFGRFPHRNKLLGRTSTPEELEFLKQKPMGF